MLQSLEIIPWLGHWWCYSRGHLSEGRCSIDNVHGPPTRERKGPINRRVYHDHVTMQGSITHWQHVYCISTTTTMSQSDKNSNQYWYPNMGSADIIDSLDGWGLSVTHHQLVKPTPEFVLSVYCACLQKVVGLDEDSLQEPAQSALFSLDEPSTVRNFGQPLCYELTLSQDMYSSAINTNFLVYHMYARHLILVSLSEGLQSTSC